MTPIRLLCILLCSFVSASSSLADLIFDVDLNYGAVGNALAGAPTHDVNVQKIASEYSRREGVSLGQAHFQLAKAIGKSGNVRANAGQFVRHLESAVDEEYKANACRRALGQIYMHAGQFAKAEKHLSTIDRPSVELLLIRARCLVAVGQRDKATQIGEEALALSKELLLSDPSIENETRWIACLLFMEDFPAAVKFLTDPRRGAKRSYASQMLTNTYVEWFDVLRRGASFPSDVAMDKLFCAMNATANDRHAIERWIGIIRAASGQTKRQRQLAVWLNGVELTAHEYLVLGSVCHQYEMRALGIQLLQNAYALEPTNPDVLNNLASFLSQEPNPELDKALAIANRLVELTPDRLEFRETRGQIHVLREDWGAAKEDLETAKIALPMYRPLQHSLAHVYRKLGFDNSASINDEENP